MNDYISIRNQFCPNPVCRFYKKVMAENVITHSQTAGRMRCKSCGRTWVAHRNEVRFGLRSDPKKIQAAIEMFKAEISIRKIAREIKVSTSTIQRWKRKFKNPIIT